jgi:succinyl-diaminopimelate desuccinylase
VLEFVGPGFAVERFAAAGKPSALLWSGDGATRPPLRVILNAHLDVVPAGPDQFRPRRDGDRLYARGAHDMKVAALVQALVFRELAGRLPVAIGLQLVTDEEVGGRHGTLHQIERGVTADFVVIGEQSGLEVVCESKGLVAVRLVATGRGGHSAYPWLADNALARLVRTVNRILDRYPTPAAEEWRTTVNLARIHTPNRAFNQVPDAAEAQLDFRYPPGDGSPVEYLTGLAEPGIEVIVDHADPPHHADPERPEVRLLRTAARAQGYRGGLLRKHGAADGRFYSARGVDAVIFGIEGAGQHGPEEYVHLPSVPAYHAALTGFLSALA